MAGTWLVGDMMKKLSLSVYSAFSFFFLSKESSVHIVATVAAVARRIEKRQTMGVRSPSRVKSMCEARSRRTDSLSSQFEWCKTVRPMDGFSFGATLLEPD